MAAGSVSLCGALLFFCSFLSVSADQKSIRAEAGQTVTLPCRSQNKSILVVEWSRPDLKSEYVLFYRDGQFDLEDQHPSFKNRVDLQDRQMKDEDVSFILKDVTIADTGTYECRVFLRGTNRGKRAHLDGDPICVIHLVVVPPGSPRGRGIGGVEGEGGKEDGSVGLIAGLSVFGLLLVSALVVGL